MLLAGRESFSMEGLVEVAEILGLDPDQAGVALREHSYREPVAEDMKAGEEAGVHGTPTFFIDGERLAGHWRQLAEVIPSAIERRRAAL